ncbi:hypothetical protein GQ473_05700 [archaeon]|nr:hypothetical protein [archaeon]
MNYFNKKGELSINTMILLALGILVLALIIGLILKWKGDSIELVESVLKLPKMTP